MLVFDMPQEALDRIIKACGMDGFVPAKNFGRCKAMCGIAKDDVRARQKREEAAKKAKESLPKQGTPSKMKKEEQTTPAPADGPVRV